MFSITALCIKALIIMGFLGGGEGRGVRYYHDGKSRAFGETTQTA